MEESGSRERLPSFCDEGMMATAITSCGDPVTPPVGRSAVIGIERVVKSGAPPPWRTTA